MKNKKNMNENINNKTDQVIHRAYLELEKKDFFTVEEAASLLMRSSISVKQAVRRGELHGLILDHQVVSISRQAILDWLHTRPRQL